MEMVLWTSEVGEEGKKPWWATIALYGGQEDSTVGKTVGGTAMDPSYPQVPTVGMAKRPARGRHL